MAGDMDSVPEATGEFMASVIGTGLSSPIAAAIQTAAPRIVSMVVRNRTFHHAMDANSKGKCIDSGDSKAIMWERRHYFQATLTKSLKAAAQAKNLMVRMKGVRSNYKVRKTGDNHEIVWSEDPVDEAFRLTPKGRSEWDDVHYVAVERKWYCALWSYGAFQLTLVKAKWKDGKRDEHQGQYEPGQRGFIAAGISDSEAPIAANGDSHQNREKYGTDQDPAYRDLDIGEAVPGWSGEMKYLYMPEHCLGGRSTIGQLADDPILGAMLKAEIGRRNWNKVMRARDGNFLPGVGSMQVMVRGPSMPDSDLGRLLPVTGASLAGPVTQFQVGETRSAHLHGLSNVEGGKSRGTIGPGQLGSVVSGAPRTSREEGV